MAEDLPIEYELLKDVVALNLRVLDTKVEHFGENTHVKIVMQDVDALLQGDPQYRYQHFKLDVQDKVFAAVRLHSARRGLAGVGEAGHRAEAEKEARTLGGLPTGSWCGVFAYAQATKGGGMDRTGQA